MHIKVIINKKEYDSFTIIEDISGKENSSQFAISMTHSFDCNSIS